MQKLAALIAFLLISTALVFAQEEQSGIIRSADGFLIVWNEPGNNFTLEVKGNKLEPGRETMMFRIDGKFFQVQTAGKKLFLKSPDDTKLDDKAVLAAHRDWERDYIADVLKRELKVESEWIKLPGGKDALAWSYDMPKVVDNQTAKKQFYLTVVKRDHVLVLNSALEDERAEKETKQLLLQSLLTLKPSDKPMSLLKASEQIKKGTNDQR
jgi:hypothetical protein